MDNNCIFKINEKIILENVGDECVLLDLESGKFFTLNATGQKIIELIKSNINLGEMIKILSDNNEQEVKRDLTSFLDDLNGRGFIEVSYKGT